VSQPFSLPVAYCHHLFSRDALHLATAMEIGDDLEGIVIYDERLADAARCVT
jgi:predicted nucleic acid-binding protein